MPPWMVSPTVITKSGCSRSTSRHTRPKICGCAPPVRSPMIEKRKSFLGSVIARCAMSPPNRSGTSTAGSTRIPRARPLTEGRLMPAILAQKGCEERHPSATTTVRRIPNVEWLATILHWTDSIAMASLPPIAAWILVTGLDDLFLLAMWVVEMLRGGSREWDAALETSGPERRIAIFIPLWHEDTVIAEMIEHNIAAIRYLNYDIFAGAYPNDHATQQAVKSVADRFPNVHLCGCPHDGPTSK